MDSSLVVYPPVLEDAHGYLGLPRGFDEESTVSSSYRDSVISEICFS